LGENQELGFVEINHHFYEIMVAFFKENVVYLHSIMKRSEYIFLFYCIGFLLLHLWGTVFPSHLNWGTQSFAFYNLTIGLIAIFVASAAFIIFSRNKVYSSIEKKIYKIPTVPTWVSFVAVTGLLIFVALTYPSEAMMWGDSKIILLTTPKIPTSTEASANFRNQPLVLLTLGTLQNLMFQNGSGDLKEVYKAIDLAAGVIFLGFVFFFISRLRTNRLNKILAVLFLISGGGTQFFFGYIENYALLYAFTAGYMVTGWLALKKEIPIFIPLVIFMVMAGLHLGALAFIPTIFIFFHLIWRENKLKAILLGAGGFAAVFVIFWLSNYSLYRLAVRIGAAFKYDFLPLITPSAGSAYTMISPIHILDWMNLNLLVAPFSLVAVIIFIFMIRPRDWATKPENIFLIGTSLFGLLFTFIMNPALGMFRDWDMMASFFVPLIFFSVILFIENITEGWQKYFYFLITVLTIVHTTARIGINADESKHLQRAEVLTDPKFMAKFAEVFYYDRLANAFWERHEYARAKRWYEKYIAIDSSNPRIIANLSDVYRKLNEKENVYRMLKRSVELGTRDPKVFSNLALEFYNRDKISEAIAMAETAVAIAPNYATGHANLGLIYCRTENINGIITHIETAVKLGMTDPFLFGALGDAYTARGNINEAINWYSRYLSQSPGDTAVANKLIKFSTLKKNFKRQK
jgi:Flp pilus assembly protein TadD